MPSAKMLPSHLSWKTHGRRRKRTVRGACPKTGLVRYWQELVVIRERQTYYAACPIAEEDIWGEIKWGKASWRRRPLFSRKPLTLGYSDQIYPRRVTLTPLVAEVRSYPTPKTLYLNSQLIELAVEENMGEPRNRLTISMPPQTGGPTDPSLWTVGDGCAFPAVALGRGQTPNPVFESSPLVPETHLLLFLPKLPKKPWERQMVK
jgi:hypothetical protein